MKRFSLIGLACIGLLTLSACSNNKAYYHAQVRKDLTQETWIHHVKTDPSKWRINVDSWFYTNEPSRFDQFDSNAPAGKAVTAMMVRVPNFTNINIIGPYKIQIVGRQERNSVFVLGPNNEARHTAVDVYGNTVFIHPPTECNNGCSNLREVIVRIGINDLQNLTQKGSGIVEGKDITSTGLVIKSSGTSDILLSGNMNLKSVVQAGPGSISVIGAYTPNLQVYMPGNGNVNISGHVGINSVSKQGCGNLVVTGTDTDSLTIDSTGSGTTSIAGYANLKKVNVSGYSKVYLYWVNSNGIYANVNDHARLGLAGSAKDLDVEVTGYSRFEGKYLHADNIYVRTRNWSHANVSPVQKLFASAMDDSSIYFFGAPNVVSRYTTGNGIVIPIFNDTCPTSFAQPTREPVAPVFTTCKTTPKRSYKGEVSYKDELSYKGETVYKTQSTFKKTTRRYSRSNH